MASSWGSSLKLDRVECGMEGRGGSEHVLCLSLKAGGDNVIGPRARARAWIDFEKE